MNAAAHVLVYNVSHCCLMPVPESARRRGKCRRLRRSQGSRTNIERIAGLYVTGEGGRLLASAGGDLTLNAAQIVTAGDTALLAGHDLKLGTVTERLDNRVVWDSKNWRSDAGSAEVGTAIQSQGDLVLQAGHDVNARAAQVEAGQGLTVLAGNDIRLAAGEATLSLDEAHRHKSKGTFSSTTRITRDTLEQSTAVGSSLGGETVLIQAGRDLTLTGSNAVADADIALIAGRDLTLEAATQTDTETHFKAKKKSGLFSSGGFGVTIGSQQNSTDQHSEGTTAAASTVGSLTGDVTLLAGEHYRQSGSDVLAPQGDIGIAAQAVDIVEAREASRTTVEQKFKQSGLTLAITSPVISAIQTAQQMKQAASNTESGRMKALAAATTGLAAYDAKQQIVKGQGVTANGKDHQIPTGQMNPDGTPEYRDASAAEQVGGVNLSISIGASKSSSKTTQTSDNAAVSTLSAGRDITIVATGAGKESDITLQGAQIDATRNLTLSAEDEIKLRAAANTADQKSSNKNSSGSIGISFGSDGLLLNLSASGGRGKADGTDLVHTNTHVTAGETLTLQSGGDTTLKGAVARGERVVADIGGDLLIESLQDTSRYESKQKSLGGSLSIGYGRMSGSVSASGSKVKSDYASVTEQTGIRAGDGGFDVQVGGDTTLTGGAITSTQEAIDQKRNRFETGGELTLTDIENKAEYEAKGGSINLGAGVSTDGKLKPQGTSAGFGSDSDDAQSMTLAAISDMAGNKEARTGDAETGIGRIFDAEKVQKEIDAQVQITQLFGQQASKAVGDYADTKLREAQALRAQGREQEASELEAQWGANGTLRLAAHTLIGGLTGGASGAAGAAVGTLTAPAVADALAQAEITGPLATTIIALASTAAGAAVGGTAGGSTALNEVANNYLDHKRPSMLRLSEKERYEQAFAACESGDDAACRARNELAARSAERDAELAQACAGNTPEQCGTLARQAIAMGNIVYGANGGYVYASSPESGPIRFLNTATIGLPGRPDSFHDQLAKSTAEGLLLEGQGQLLGALLSAAGKGVGAVNTAVKDYFAGRGVVVSDELAAKIANNFYRDGSIANPGLTMSVQGPWKSVAELTPAEANLLITSRLPAGAKITGIESANIINTAAVTKGYQAPFIPGTNVIDLVTTQPTNFVRVFVGTQGTSSQVGTWIMRAEDIAGLSAQQIASKFSLPQVPTMITDVTVPAGTRLQVSAANGISPNSTGLMTGGNAGGGGVQFQIQQIKELPKGWFTNPRGLP